MLDVVMIAGGLVLLLLGGEGLIRGAVSLACSFRLSKLLVSSVIIGFGTSMPELTISVSAALKGSPDIALGNVVGSNIANVLLIVGVAALIAPVSFSVREVRRDALVMLAASLLLCGVSFFGIISSLTGGLMLLALVTYVAWSYVEGKKGQPEEEPPSERTLAPPVAALLSLAGLVFLVAGAYLMVEGAVALARHFGISEAVIGLTIVAVGTSLPELVTAIVASRHKENDIIIGNILGSNVFNILCILGVTALVSPIPFAGRIAAADIWIMLGVAMLLSGYLLRGRPIGRLSGALMLAGYIAYTLWLYGGQGF